MNKIIAIFLFVSVSFGGVSAYTESQSNSANKLGEQEIIVLQDNPSDYRLDDTITRKEFMKVVVKIVGEQVEDMCEGKFSDVEGDWGCKYIEWALSKSFIAANANFRPDDTITKAESMKLILKARGIDRIENSGDWRQDDMRTASRKCIISGEYSDYDTKATRGWIFEAAATEVCSGNENPSSSSGSGNESSGNQSGELEDWRNLVP